MKPYPISLQLYSVREEAAQDFPGVLKKVADLGYIGVEFAGLHDMAPADVRAILDDLGLVCSSTHGPMPAEDNLDEVIATAKTLGYKHHVSGFGPDQFATKETILESAALAQKAAELLKDSGLTFGIHNHYWEFDHEVDGKYPHEVFMEAAPDALAQIDTYWVKVGGADPVAIVRQYGARAPLLHLKDGPGNKEEAMTAIGGGIMDWPPLIEAAADTTEWLIVELDRCDTDMMEAVAESYCYLVGNGLATGRK